MWAILVQIKVSRLMHTNDRFWNDLIVYFDQSPPGEYPTFQTQEVALSIHQSVQGAIHVTKTYFLSTCKLYEFGA